MTRLNEPCPRDWYRGHRCALESGISEDVHVAAVCRRDPAIEAAVSLVNVLAAPNIEFTDALQKVLRQQALCHEHAEIHHQVLKSRYFDRQHLRPAYCELRPKGEVEIIDRFGADVFEHNVRRDRSV